MSALSKYLSYAPTAVQTAVQYIIDQANDDLYHLILKVAGIALPSAYVVSLIQWYFTNPIARLPGPWYPVFNPYGFLVQMISGTTHTHFVGLHKKYGTTIRMGKTFISTMDPAIVRDVLITRDLPKAKLYDSILLDGQQNLFSTRSKELHQRLRRFLSPAFSIKYLNGLEPLLLKCIQQQHARLQKAIVASSDNSTNANLYDEAHYTALDIIGETAFGRSFGMLDGNHHVLPGYLGAQLQYTASTNLFPFLRNIPIGINNRAKQRQTYVEEFMKTIIVERREQREKIAAGLESPESVRNDILQLCVMGKDEITGVNLTDEEIKSHTILFLIAGTDTSSNTMTFTIIRLLQNPSALFHLISQLDTLPLDPTTGLIPHSALKDCTYLDACIRESMRLDPVAVNFPRDVPEDMVLGGKMFVKKGTTVFVNNWSMHLDGDVWESPEEYRPERWEGKKGDLYDSFYPFSAGTRNCIGKNFAWMELRLFIGNLLRKFHIEQIPDLDQSLATENFITVSLKSHKYLIKSSKLNPNPVPPSIKADNYLIQFFICTTSDADCCPIDIEPDREIACFKTTFFRIRSLDNVTELEDQRTEDFDYDSVPPPPIVFDEEPILEFKELPPQMPPTNIISELLTGSSELPSELQHLLAPFDDTGGCKGFDSTGEFDIQLGGWISHNDASFLERSLLVGHPTVPACEYCVEDADVLLPEDVECTPIKRPHMQPFLTVHKEFLDMWHMERTDNYSEVFVVLWQCPVHISYFKARHLQARG
ncbi:hypothetical protein HK097_011058 [Rhizophlyctis rosea]|uniref:Cytochrome P450 n=1 Tax=Rhizophlyctis rosea TaxID=64517 RepID=A0AAD5X4W0_9FUNG|nr:hypothetical protein HK097_011058 [Rhizophlyctis rosea]